MIIKNLDSCVDFDQLPDNLYGGLTSFAFAYGSKDSEGNEQVASFAGISTDPLGSFVLNTPAGSGGANFGPTFF